MNSAGPEEAKIKLSSVRQLEQELGRRRGSLAQLVAERDREQDRLKATREKHERLGAEIRTLNQGIATKNQSIFVLVDEVDWLLRVQDRVHKRAAELAKDRNQPRPDYTKDRTHTREPLAVQVTFKSETNFYVGFSQNISGGGLFVSTYDTRPVGERFPIEFELPAGAGVVHCLVEVAWVREYREGDDLTDPPGMGLRFIGLDDTDRQHITQFLEHREPLFFPEFDELS